MMIDFNLDFLRAAVALVDTSLKRLNNDAQSSTGIDADASYPIANALHEILAPHPARSANLTPFLTQWRDALPT